MRDRDAEACFRIVYERLADVRADLAEMARGGVLVKVPATDGLVFDAPVALELVMPDGASIATRGKVLHVFPGVGVAVTVGPDVLAAVTQHATGGDSGSGAPRHARVDAEPETRPTADGADAASTARPRSALAPTAIDAMTHAEKIQIALHGNRDQRNAILRDPNRTLHPFVLKNPQLSTDDVLAIAKNAQMHPELLGQIAQRKEWFQRPPIALALARNPKTPPEVGVKALEHCPIDALRQLAKGTGAMPHIVAAARKKVIK